MTPNRSIMVIALTAWLAAGSCAGQSKRVTLDPAQGWQQHAIEADQDRAELDRARELIATGKPAKAKSILTAWLEDDANAQSPYRAEAYRLRGDARTALGYEYNALYDYERVIREYPSSKEFVIAVAREVEIGDQFLHGLRKKLLGVRFEKVTSTGEELLIRAMERMPGSLLAEDAAIKLADYYFEARKLELAADMYDIFLDMYPNSPHRMHAMQRQIYSNIARFKGPNYDGSILLESRELIQRFAREYPAEAERAGLTNALVVRLEESAAAQELESARWYLRRGDGPSARFVLRRLVRDHTGTVAATTGLALLQDHGWLDFDAVETDQTIGPEPTP